MLQACLIILFSAVFQFTEAQVDSFIWRKDVLVCIDRPGSINQNKETILCFFALPNGNTIQQTFGKKLQPGDDWHYDIQHIGAQTAFIRNQLPDKNFIVIYLATVQKSWPAWKKTHTDYKILIPALIDTIKSITPPSRTIYLNGHSGGGSFIFGYLDAVDIVPDTIARISFIDSNYGYDSTYYPKFKAWLERSKKHVLTVFAYNDSVALYNGKPIVSPTGGTWYRSHLMIQQLQKDMNFHINALDSLIFYRSKRKNVFFILKTNPDQKIFHTQQVELNGFIHSILLGTKKASKDYKYFEARAYTNYIH